MIHILVRAFEVDGGYSLTEFFLRFFSADIWGLGCLIGPRSYGVAINSLFLGLMTGLGTTILGLTFALIFTRTDFRAKIFLRILTVLPIFTPPFVIGLALILLFGRAGTVTEFFPDMLGWEKTRWLHGFWRVYFAQLLSFTPIAFLVLIGVVQGVSPSIEEASKTLDADRLQTFRFVSLPLMRPGLVNAFLLGFMRKHRGLRRPTGLGQRLQRAVDRDCLCHRRLGRRPRQGRNPCHWALISDHVCLHRAAFVAGQKVLRDNHG